MSNLPKNSLFIGDLSIFCTESDLQELFSPFGPLLEVKIMKSEDKGRSLSYGFVKYAEPSDAMRAMSELQHKLLHGRNMRIAWASYKSKGASFLPHPENLETSAVHVSFISYQIRNLVNEASLRHLFGQYGEVSDVSIKKSSVDKSINRQSGYGFVHYPITQTGIFSAIRAATELQDTTVEEVNYKSSLSHKLTVFIEENSAFFENKCNIPQQHVINSRLSHEHLHITSSDGRGHGSIVSVAPVMPPTTFNYVPLPLSGAISNPQLPPPIPSPPMPSRPLHTYGQISSFPTNLVVPPQFRPTGDQTYLLSPVIQYVGHSPHQLDYRYPIPNYSMFPANISSPVQALNSPQGYYLADSRFGFTPSSISSVETISDNLRIVDPLLRSPSEYVGGKRSSPVNQYPPISTSNATPKNANLNLKKLRQKSLRKQLNQLETAEGGAVPLVITDLAKMEVQSLAQEKSVLDGDVTEVSQI